LSGPFKFFIWEKTALLCERDSCKHNQKSTDVFWSTISGVEHSEAAPGNQLKSRAPADDGGGGVKHLAIAKKGKRSNLLKGFEASALDIQKNR